MTELNASDAILLLSKWRDEKTVLWCNAKLIGSEFNLKGRVIDVSQHGFVFCTMHDDARFGLRLDLPDSYFWYAEARELPSSADIPEERKESSGLGVALPLRFTPDELTGPMHKPVRERFVFLELARKEEED